ncbi:MAG: tRNA (adenosine(37)-N6)-threonylcarbamoyltransferase complex ATPase subunit type 1 TsaE [Pricia sp.]
MKIKYTESQIHQVARQLIDNAASKTFAFYAPMGAGKTTLIKAILKELGAADTGSSPTFGIVNEYHDPKGSLMAYHFDFYRLNSETEALDLGLEDYLNQEVWTFMEWPEKIGAFLPEDSIEVRIEIVDMKTRVLELKHEI